MVTEFPVLARLLQTAALYFVYLLTVGGVAQW